MKKRLIYFITFILTITVIAIFAFSEKKETVAVIGAMDVEIEEIAANLSNITKQANQNTFEITTGNLGKYKIILTKSGVGKVASATTAQYIIDKYKPEYIANIGIAGSISPEIKAGDTIIAEKMIQHDFDVTAFGNPKGYIDNGIEPDKPTIFYSDKALVDKYAKENTVKLGTIATGDIFVTDTKLKNSIRQEFGADAVDMESAAIAQTAKRNNIPIIVFRTISDGLNGTTEEYNQNKQDIAKKPASIIIRTLKSK